MKPRPFEPKCQLVQLDYRLSIVLSYGQLKQQHATFTTRSCLTWENTAKCKPTPWGTWPVGGAHWYINYIPADPNLFPQLQCVWWAPSTSVFIPHRNRQSYYGWNLKSAEQWQQSLPSWAIPELWWSSRATSGRHHTKWRQEMRPLFVFTSYYSWLVLNMIIWIVGLFFIFS